MPYNIIHSFSLSNLPASLLNTRNVARQRVHAKLELQYQSAIRTSQSVQPIMSRAMFLVHDPLIFHNAFLSNNSDRTHPSHSKVPQYTSPLSPHDTSIPDLRGPGIAVHLAQLELSLRSRSLGERGIADDITQGLSAVSYTHLTLPTKRIV